MIRSALLVLPALLAGCVTSGTGFSPAAEQVALQRMRFAVEAVCLNNDTRGAQDRAARTAGFPIRERQDGGVNYVNLETLTFLRLAPAPTLSVMTEDGPRAFEGMACSVGSPAVDVDTANRVVGEILAPRLVEGDTRLSGLIGAGENEGRGVGLFFEDLIVTVAEAETTLLDGETGEGVRFVHPTILILHR